MAVALLIAAAVLLSGRYELTTDMRTGAILRIDRLTGAVRLCIPTKANALDYDCSGAAGDWVSVPGG